MTELLGSTWTLSYRILRVVSCMEASSTSSMEIRDEHPSTGNCCTPKSKLSNRWSRQFLTRSVACSEKSLRLAVVSTCAITLHTRQHTGHACHHAPLRPPFENPSSVKRTCTSKSRRLDFTFRHGLGGKPKLTVPFLIIRALFWWSQQLTIGSL